MKRYLLITIGLILAFFVGRKVHADEQNRFDLLSKEKVGNWGGLRSFETYHDRESGQEFVCAISAYNGDPACFLTGRNWK
jgi:hypothetical protein